MVDKLWAFLDDRECHVYLENDVCVDLMTYSTTSIRKVVLVLQLPYKDIHGKLSFLSIASVVQLATQRKEKI